MNYDLQLELVKKKIKEVKAKKVLIQLPSGLRVHVLEVVNAVIEAGAEPVIWAGSCYGTCDLPVLTAGRRGEARSDSTCDLPDYKKVDLLIHFGHEEFKK